MINLLTNLPSSLIGRADPLSDLHQNRHQAGLLLQLLPHSAAAALPQRRLHLTEPALEERVSVGILQQPAST